MYQQNHKQLPTSFNTLNYFMELGRPQTRHYTMANFNRFRTTYTSLLPLHTFPRIWNDLDTAYQYLASLNIFKKKVKTYFILRMFNVITLDVSSAFQYIYNLCDDIHPKTTINFGHTL